jgi:type IV pilus assembly protein PilA
MHKRREGFTLIELLIVIVIIGILAAIALPKFGATREKAYVKAMESDLRNLAAQQEIYYSDSGSLYKYFGDGGTPLKWDANQTNPLNLTISDGVTLTISSTAAVAPNPAFWSATSAHQATSKTCSIFTGGTAIAPAITPGVIACTP